MLYECHVMHVLRVILDVEFDGGIHLWIYSEERARSGHIIGQISKFLYKNDYVIQFFSGF